MLQHTEWERFLGYVAASYFGMFSESEITPNGTGDTANSKYEENVKLHHLVSPTKIVLAGSNYAHCRR